MLVMPAPAEEKIGGIIIPDTAKENLCAVRLWPLATERKTRK